MKSLALPLLAVAAIVQADERTFWKVDPGLAQHPIQKAVAAERAGEGRNIVVYREKGYVPSAAGADEERAQVESAIAAFDEVIYPRQVALFGPCPDLDGNGKVIVLLTALTHGEGHYFRFDSMSEAEASARGFHSNQAEILYLSFRGQGNRAAANVAVLARVFHELLHAARDPAETSWAAVVGRHAAFLCDVAPARRLWGEDDPLAAAPSPGDPWSPHGWPPLLVEYLHERLGDPGLKALVTSTEPGQAALSAAVGGFGGQFGDFEALADFALACWLDDPRLGDGRFAFDRVTPPRPPLVARLPASRPTSGQTLVGVGGMAFLLIDADRERSLSLTLRGDPRARWLARAVILPRDGPDRQVPLAFEAGGIARLSLEALHAGDAALVAVVPVPADEYGLDRRRVALQWGLGWVPQVAADRSRDGFLELLREQLPDGGTAARTRLSTTIARLGGRPGGGTTPPLSTRYAWSPATADVLLALKDEAQHRGLTSRLTSFLRLAPENLRQEWHNVLIELPGRDPRRWPVVLAAHWDGARGRLDDSYLRALNLNDNASGVAVALEAAAAVARTPHRAPVVVALLGGGYHGHAGADALLSELQGKASAWIELEGVGIPEPWPRHLSVTLAAAPESEQLVSSVAGVLRAAGLTPKRSAAVDADHTGVAPATSRRIPTLVIRLGDTEADLDEPPAAEQARLSPELMVLLAKASATAVVKVAGVP